MLGAPLDEPEILLYSSIIQSMIWELVPISGAGMSLLLPMYGYSALQNPREMA